MFPFTFTTLLYPKLPTYIVRYKYFPSPLRHGYTANSLPVLLDTNVSPHLYDTVIPLTPYLYC
jgi:hypothetical protein